MKITIKSIIVASIEKNLNYSKSFVDSYNVEYITNIPMNSGKNKKGGSDASFLTLTTNHLIFDFISHF